jgi:hypothetical protein
MEPGNGKHLFAHVNGLLGRNQRARACGGFYYQTALRQACDEPIALGKVGGDGRRVERVLTKAISHALQFAAMPVHDFDGDKRGQDRCRPRPPFEADWPRCLLQVRLDELLCRRLRPCQKPPSSLLGQG